MTLGHVAPKRRGGPALLGGNRRLTPAQESSIRTALRGIPITHGGSASTKRSALIRELASQYRVSVRCIHRTLEREERPVVEVVIGSYRAVFEDNDSGPIQLTPWMAAP